MARIISSEAHVGLGDDVAPEHERLRLERQTLHAIIGVVGSSPDLDRVLAGIVELLTEATDCHACFVYLREADRLLLRGASQVYQHLIGRVGFGVDQGLAGWVARNRTPAFIRDEALADPRMKYVPELEEERFQSMVAVPMLARSGQSIGVVVLHTEAPREFDDGVLTFLAHTASLVSGAVENAQLYGDARRRVEILTGLASLSRDIAGATTREGLYRVATAGVRGLLRCDACRLYLLDDERGGLHLAAADPAHEPEGAPSPWPAEGTAVLLELLRRHAPRARRDGHAALLASPVAAGEEDLGVLAVTAGRALGYDEDEILQAVGHQLAVALKKAELIERLTAENVVRDLFEALALSRSDVAEARGRVAGCDLSRRHVVVHVRPVRSHDDARPWPAVAEHTEARLRRLAPGAICDVGSEEMRALLPLAARADDEEPLRLERLLDGLGGADSVVIGVSAARRGLTDGSRSLREAADAAQIARALAPGGGGLAYRDLGAYKYLVRLPLDEAPDDRHAEAVDRLLDYDRRRRSELVTTLEQYLRDRRSITAARALYIHPNTLRQRLERIETLSGLDLASEDLVSLELAIKLARLRSEPAPAARGGDGAHP